MNWLLTLLLIGPDGAATYKAGFMANEDTCQLAGASMSLMLETSVPDLKVGWTCARQDEV